MTSTKQKDLKDGSGIVQTQSQATDDSDKLSLVKEPPPPPKDAKSASSIHIEQQLEAPTAQDHQRQSETQNSDQSQDPGQRQNQQQQQQRQQQRQQEPKPLKRRSKLLFFLTCHSYNRNELLEKPPAPRRSEPSRVFRARQRLPSSGGKSSTSATADSRSVAKAKNRDVTSSNSREDDRAQQSGQQQQPGQGVENESDQTTTAVDRPGTDARENTRKSIEHQDPAKEESTPKSITTANTTVTTTTTTNNADAGNVNNATDSEPTAKSKDTPADEHTPANPRDSAVTVSQAEASDSPPVTNPGVGASAAPAPATASATAAPIERDIDDVILGDNTTNEAHTEESSSSKPPAPAPGGDGEAEEVDDETARALDEAVTSPTPPAPAEAGLEQQQQQASGPPPPPTQVSVAEPSPSPATEVVAEERKPSLLPPLEPRLKDRKCLVLDLDETLVHSSLKPMDHPDFMIPVEIEGQNHNIYVIKRPHVDEFMRRVGELYEVVIFTASVSKYGDPLLDQLDIHQSIHHRLFRDSCLFHPGNYYVKDLSRVGRDLRHTIIIDNSPMSYIFHPNHAIPISTWFSDIHDNELLDLIPVLEDLAKDTVCDVSLVLNVEI